MPSFFRHDLFDLRVSRADNGLFDTEQYVPLKTICADRSYFSFSPVDVDADPYLFVHDDVLYLFYEEQKIKQKGCIKMTRTSDLVHWSEPVVVLKEPFHLSYPHVFREGGQIFMMPETGESQSIRIYRPGNESLTEWILHKELMTGAPYVDSSVIVEKGVYYLFTTVRQGADYTLKLFTAGSLTGQWTEHPASPICTGSEAGRCGGAIFRYEDAIYRPAQKCVTEYGEALAIYRITELTETSYREELVTSSILPAKDPFYRNGGHHINFVRFRGALIVSTDARGTSLNVFCFIKRVADFVKRKLTSKE